MRRLDNSRLPLWAWAAITVMVVGLAVLAVVLLTLRPPGSNAFSFHALITTDAKLNPGSPVRVAGVDVGRIASIDASAERPDASDLTIELDSGAPPIYEDATLEVRSRLVFEGNFALAIEPGSPTAGEISEGATLAPEQTTGPVQFDRVLSDLTAPTRTSLQVLIQGFGRSLGEPSNGSTAAQAVNESFADWPGALRGNAIVATAFQGRHPHDLSRLVAGSRRVLAAMAAQREPLGELVVGLDRTLSSVASRQEDLRRALALLPGTVTRARTATAELNDALPSTRTFARSLQPGMARIPAAIETGTPWVRQATGLLGDGELGSLAPMLADVSSSGAGLTATAEPLVRRIDRIDRCWLNVLLPAGEIVIDDAPLPSGGNVRDEFLQSFVGVASAAQNFDANGPYVRAQTAGGSHPVETSPLPEQGEMRGNAAAEPLGTRPAKVDSAPPYEPDSVCAQAGVPDLNSAITGPTP